MRRVPAVAVPVLAAVAGSFSVFAPGTVVAHVAYEVGFAVCVTMAWIALRAIQGPGRMGYGLIVGALTIWQSGDLLYDFLDHVAGPLGDVTPSDALWISGYPLLVAGLIKLTRLRAPGRLRDAMLDALAMATVVAWLFWQFLILPAAENQDLNLAVVVGAFYPFGDVTIFAATAILVMAPGSTKGPARYLIGALVLTLIGDISISLLPVLFPTLTRGDQAARFDGLLLFANSLLAAAVVHKDAGKVAEPEDVREMKLHPARVVFLGIALVVLPTVSGMQYFGSLASRISLLLSIGLLTTFILFRFVFVVRDQERVRSVLAHQAEHDQLTGLANRPALLARLDGALHRPGNGYGPVIFYLDLNGFKQVNDRYGHAAGDRVLIEFARRLRDGVRPTDVAARLGGDEFAVLATEVADDSQARAMADRLRALAAEPVEGVYAIGVSVGFAAAGPPAQGGNQPQMRSGPQAGAGKPGAGKPDAGEPAAEKAGAGEPDAGEPTASRLTTTRLTADALMAAADAEMYVEKVARHAAADARLTTAETPTAP